MSRPTQESDPGIFKHRRQSYRDSVSLLFALCETERHIQQKEGKEGRKERRKEGKKEGSVCDRKTLTAARTPSPPCPPLVTCLCCYDDPAHVKEEL